MPTAAPIHTNTGPPLLKRFRTLFYSNTEDLNMDLLSNTIKKQNKNTKTWFVCAAVLRAVMRESIHRHVRAWATCNGIILTRTTPHCHHAFFSRAREIDISFTNIPGIFFSRPDFFGALFTEKTRSTSCAP